MAGESTDEAAWPPRPGDDPTNVFLRPAEGAMGGPFSGSIERTPSNRSDANGTRESGSGPAGTGSAGIVPSDPAAPEAVADPVTSSRSGSGAGAAIASVASDLDHSLHPDRSPRLPAAPPSRSTIPDIVIRRLPIYVRTLRDLAREEVASVSSEDLAERIGVTAAQIRRDLSYFGRFGTQGKGYETGYLAEAIARILRLDRQWDVALAGLGNLGRAIVNYRGFGPSSFDVVALFDANAGHVGQEIAGLAVLGHDRITDEVRARGIRIGIVAVRASAAQDVTDRMVAGGIQAILNYAPVVLKVPPGVTVREIDPVSALQSMTYYVDEAEEGGSAGPMGHVSGAGADAVANGIAEAVAGSKGPDARDTSRTP